MINVKHVFTTFIQPINPLSKSSISMFLALAARANSMRKPIRKEMCRSLRHCAMRNLERRTLEYEILFANATWVKDLKPICVGSAAIRSIVLKAMRFRPPPQVDNTQTHSSYSTIL